jgi:2'-5' RNA ligase superfamily
VALEYHEGQTVLLAPVEQAEPVVARWREEFDATAAEGVPAHIPVLFPFVDREELDDRVLEAVGEVLGAHGPIEFRLFEVRRFPDRNVYLAPDPEQPFRRLTEAIWRRWPDHPPYEGHFDEIIPHLTVAIEPPEERASEIEGALRAALPIHARVNRVELLCYESGRWRTLAAFNLGR